MSERQRVVLIGESVNIFDEDKGVYIPTGEPLRKPARATVSSTTLTTMQILYDGPQLGALTILFHRKPDFIFKFMEYNGVRYKIDSYKTYSNGKMTYYVSEG